MPGGCPRNSSSNPPFAMSIQGPIPARGRPLLVARTSDGAAEPAAPTPKGAAAPPEPRRVPAPARPVEARRPSPPDVHTTPEARGYGAG